MYIYSISYWSEVNIIIIKPQFDFLHHQEEKALRGPLSKKIDVFKELTPRFRTYELHDQGKE